MEIDAESEAQSYEALELIDQIKPILGGHSPAVISAVIADLFALFLAGHQDPAGEGARIDGIREKIIERWVTLVKDLIPINAAQVRERHGLDGRPN
jgi:hypothetical protein